MAQWNCAGLENPFPQGFPGSIPGSGVTRNRSTHRVKDTLVTSKQVYFEVFLVRALLHKPRRQNRLKNDDMRSVTLFFFVFAFLMGA